MASRRFNPSDRAADGGGDNAPLHYHRIVVVASDVGVLVQSAGGFLCDRAAEGWDVTVLLSGPCNDARPLTILGVPEQTCRDGIDAAEVIGALPRGTTLAVGADLFSSDARARHALASLAGRGLGAVTVWGAPAQPEIDHPVKDGLEPTPHPLSVAAMAFKTAALRAARINGVADPVESLYRLRGASFRRLYSV